MKDSERLDLLKDIAGTKVYETRRKESLKVMSETDSRLSQIEEIITYIEDRLAELEKEQTELHQYQVCVVCSAERELSVCVFGVGAEIKRSERSQR